MMLDSTDLVEGLTKEQRLFKVACTVTVPSHKDLRDATLAVTQYAGQGTGKDGKEHTAQVSDCKEPRKKSDEFIKLHPDVLRIQYGMTVPRKVRSEPPPVMTELKHDLAVGFGNLLTTISNRASGISNSPRPSVNSPRP